MKLSDVESQFKHIFADVINDRNEANRCALEDARDAKLSELYDAFFQNTDFRQEIKRDDLEHAHTPEQFEKIGRTLQWMWELEKNESL